MNNVEVYNKMHDMAGFEPGDTVRLLRLWNGQDFNTGTLPLTAKHKIGSIYTVTGNHIILPGHKMLSVREGGFLPFFAVELVEKKPKWEPVHVTLNDSYDAVVYKDKVEVGCQKFSFAAIERLAKIVAAAKAIK